MLGYEPSYLSALERSTKGPPKQDFIERLIRGLNLDGKEQAELRESLKASRRQVSLPADASQVEYELIRELEPQLGRLTPLQIHLVRVALRLPKSLDMPEFSIARSLPAEPEGREAPKM